MTSLPFHDFYTTKGETDCCSEVETIYRQQFPTLYHAVDRGEIKTPNGKVVIIKGDTLITYKTPIRRFFKGTFDKLNDDTKAEIRSILEQSSQTSQKKINYYNGRELINNHQIGNMMPFPSSIPSMNIERARAFHDYFDCFLVEVNKYYSHSSNYQPVTSLQQAILYQREYFDFFKSYDQYIEENLLQDFVGHDLSSITDFREFVQVANEIIDNRGRRFNVPFSV
jgi:hypothetical protein